MTGLNPIRGGPRHLCTLQELLSLLLLATSPSITHAQLTFGNAPANSTSSGVPSPTGYGAPSPDQPQNNGIVNYYFLLLGVFIVVLIAAYWTLVRRRRRKIARSRNGRQSALARDVEGWPGGRRWAQGRWRTAVAADPTPEEGLDERGEAPPPYVPGQPEAAHPVDGRPGNDAGQSIPLQDMSASGGKPPDYEPAPAPDYDIDMTRPAPTMAPSGRH
ncbi:hypothetical protein MMC24_007094 [Lignoscripta atroalba]|nr:hypothetical protein [Lignoscripta atroalba]